MAYNAKLQALSRMEHILRKLSPAERSAALAWLQARVESGLEGAGDDEPGDEPTQAKEGGAPC